MHKLIAIGTVGEFHIYADMTREEAIERYLEYHSLDELPDSEDVKEVEFDDFFHAYDIWE